MGKWMAGMRGAVVIVLLWIIGWSVGFGGIMEAFIDPDGKAGDIWPIMLAVPGLIGGVIFAGIVAAIERKRRFDEVSLFRFAIGGGFTGFLLGLLSIPAEVGDASPGAAGMIAMASVLGVVAGVGCGVFFRLISWWEGRNVPILK